MSSKSQPHSQMLHGPRIDVIITSPYIRCVQTAVHVREVLACRKVVRPGDVGAVNRQLDSAADFRCRS